MYLSNEQFDGLINKKLRTNQLLFYISVLIALTVFIFTQNPLWSFYFLIIGALSLPNINKCKEDRKLVREEKFNIVTGKVLDVFLEREEGVNWILFLENENKNVLEYLIHGDPHVDQEGQATIYISPKMKIVVKVEASM
jgi:hypothetical protein